MTSDLTAEKPRRVRRKENRPAEIAAAALAVFGERGFSATKLEDVASRAGIAKGTIYLYFATKEDLFRAVVRQELIPVLEGLEATVTAHTGPQAALLRQIFRRMARVAGGELGVIPRLVVSESANFPEIATFYAEEVIGRIRHVFAGIIARGVAQGEFRPVDAGTLTPILAGPMLLMLLWQHSIGRHVPTAFDPQAVIDLHLDLLLRGLAPESPS